jgi:hypothetical protein
MSLINDALKKAKQTLDEQRPSAAGAPPLQPAEPSPNRGFWPELLLPLLLAVALALAGIFFWRWLDQSKQPTPQTAGKVELTTTPIVRAKTVTSNPTASSASARAGSLAETPVNAATQSPVAAGESATAPGTTTGVNPSAVGGTNETANTTVAVVEPPALKLQGIFYSRKNPTAVINGKIRAVGDRIGGARLLAIDQETVTVVEGGKTNQLTLP